MFIVLGDGFVIDFSPKMCNKTTDWSTEPFFVKRFTVCQQIMYVTKAAIAVHYVAPPPF